MRGRTRPILNPAQLPFLDCEYTDFIADTPENQLLRGVLELLAPGVQNRTVRRQYDDALSYLADVSLIRPSLGHFDRVRLNRLNQHYQPSLRLARLALEGAGVVDSAGSITAPAYFVLMWQIWENAAAAALRDAGVRDLVEKPRYGSAFLHQHGQPNLTVTIEPDLVIGRRQSPRMVIDLKWGPCSAHGPSRPAAAAQPPPVPDRYLRHGARLRWPSALSTHGRRGRHGVRIQRPPHLHPHRRSQQAWPKWAPQRGRRHRGRTLSARQAPAFQKTTP